VKKVLLFGGLSLITILVLAVVIGPGLVDWNQHKSKITDLAKKSTGRDVFIDGDIQLVIFPSPAFVANGVRVANVKDAHAPEMIRLESLEVKIAPGPLLTGNVQIESVKLIRPVIEVQVFADGRHNLALEKPVSSPSANLSNIKTPPGQQEASAEPKSREDSSSSFSNTVQLDNFIIEDGRVVYRNSKEGTVERISGITGRFAAASLIGPFESSGRFIVHEIPVSFEINIGKTIHGRTVPLSATLSDQSGGSNFRLSGTVTSLTEKPNFKGNIRLEGKSLAALIRNLSGNRKALPGYLSQPFQLEGAVAGSAASIEAKKLAWQLGDVKAATSVFVDLKKSPRASLKLNADHLDLDKWLAFPASIAPLALNKAPISKSLQQQETSLSSASNATPSTLKGQPKKKDDGPGFEAAIDLAIKSITFKNDLIHKTQFSAEYAGGEVTINQLTTQLPGGADVALFGFVANEKNGPKFEGEIDFNAGNSRKVASWLGIELPNVPPGRLRRATMKANVVATSAQVGIRDLVLKFDSSKITGGVTLALPIEPISFGANLTLDKINLDAYLAKRKPTKATKVQKTETNTSGDPSAQLPVEQTKSSGGALAALSVLKSFSADVKAYAKNIRYNGQTIRGIVLDGRLFDNKLTVRRASIAKAAGASLLIKGEAAGLVGIANLKNVRINLRAPSVRKLAALVGAKLPPQIARLGKIDISGRVDGSVLKPGLDFNFKGGGATISSKGTVSFLPIIGGADMDVSIKHGSLKKLLGVLGVDYRPSGDTGGVNVRARLKAKAGSVDFEDFKGNVGRTNISGNLGVREGKQHPKITADIITGALDLNAFVPAKRRASIETSTPRFLPATWTIPTGVQPTDLFIPIAKTSSQRWSSEPLDLSALRAFDADIKLKSKSLKYDSYTLNNANIAVSLQNGAARTDKLTGSLFGGVLNGGATLNASEGVPTLTSNIKIQNLNILEAARAITRKSLASGSVDFDLNVQTDGRSLKALVSKLAGNAKIVIRNMDAKEVGGGTAFAGALGLARMMSSTSGLLGGKRGKAKGLADLTGSFVIEKGIARSQDLTITANAAQGLAKGYADLPKWMMDFSGDVTLSNDPLSTLVRGASKAPNIIPFQIYGPLDKPNVKVKTSSLPGGKLTIPGTQKLFKSKKVNRGLDVLNKLGVQIPGLTQPTPAPQGQANPTVGKSDASGLLPTPPPPPPAPAQEKKKLRIEDVLNQFKNFR
jgi:uncharacterized protein involved in outer membrane biogenesis